MAVSAAAGGVALLNPALLLSYLDVQHVTYQDVTFVRLTGATIVVGGIVDYCLQVP